MQHIKESTMATKQKQNIEEGNQKGKQVNHGTQNTIPDTNTHISKIQWEILSICFTLFFTFLGFLLTICNDYFSQYYYNDSINLLHRKPISYNDIKGKSLPPSYYFILDTSTSITEAKSVSHDESIDKKIRDIQDSGVLPEKGYNFDEDKKGFISFKQFLQVNLLYTLNKLSKSNIKNMSVITFSDKASMTYRNVDVNDYDRFQKIFREIYDEKFNGKQSDFVSLFSFLQKNIIDTLGPSASFKRRECHFILFSDYLHSVNRNSNNDRNKLEKQIQEFLKAVEKKSLDVKLHYIKDANNNKKESIITLLNVKAASKIEILDIDKEMISPKTSESPIPFYYSNSLFENNMSSQIVFNEEHNLSFGLEPKSDKMKQDYYLKIGKEKIYLTDYLHERTVSPKDTVYLVIDGYIPAPYTSPAIIIEDKEDGTKHIVPVVFYKTFPRAGYLILLSIFVLMIIMIYIGIKLYKK